MLFQKQYPFSKLFFDEEDQLHVITSTAPGQSGHEIMKIGEGLLIFLTLILRNIRLHSK